MNKIKQVVDGKIEYEVYLMSNVGLLYCIIEHQPDRWHAMVAFSDRELELQELSFHALNTLCRTKQEAKEWLSGFRHGYEMGGMMS